MNNRKIEENKVDKVKLASWINKAMNSLDINTIDE